MLVMVKAAQDAPQTIDTGVQHMLDTTKPPKF